MKQGTYQKLLRRMGFKSYLMTEFLGALNDNIFKMILSLMAVVYVAQDVESGSVFSSSFRIAMVGAVFILPFILFSGYGGYFADRYAKRDVLVHIKVLEVVVMSVAFFVLPIGHFHLNLVILFLMATQSAFFSPAKYGILPEMFSEKELSRANGLVEMTTFLAIILGAFLGAYLFECFEAHTFWRGFFMLTLAVVGYICSFGIEKTSAAVREISMPAHPWAVVVAGLRQIFNHKSLGPAVGGIIWFWFLGALIQMMLLVISKDVLNLDAFHTGLLPLFLAFGIGLGCVLAGQLSGDRVELGLVPVGGFGVGIGSLLLYTALPDYEALSFSLAFMGLFAGFFIVPLNAYVQKKAPQDKKGQTLATINFLTMSGVFIASGFFALWGLIGLPVSSLVLFIGAGTLLLTLTVLFKRPLYLLRFILWSITHIIYRLRFEGLENIPEKGPALIVSNHVSYVDGLLVSAACPGRPIRFFIDGTIYDYKLLNWFFKMIGAIPVRPGKKVLWSIKSAISCLDRGELVCIFAEGTLSRTGNILRFQKGLEKIAQKADVPVIPAHLDNIWGSFFSFSEGRFFRKWPRQLPYPVTVTFGQALPSDVPAWTVREKVVELGVQALQMRKQVNDFLPVKFLKKAKTNFWRRAFVDTTGKDLTFGQAAVATVILSRLLDKVTKQDPCVGLLFPSSVGGALANLAVCLRGQTAVNLNFTAGSKTLDKCIQKTKLKSILTSRKFIEKMDIPPRPEMIFLEDLMKAIPVVQKIAGCLQFIFIPSSLLFRMYRITKITPDHTAAIIFSSGSTGDPKGVMLSHKNLLCNIQQTLQIFPLKQRDTFLGVLPFFHSFGYTVTFWLSLLKGTSVVYHSNPLDGKRIGELLQAYQITFIISTPTFFQTYIRSCSKSQFSSVRFAIVGAEKLRKTVENAFHKKFGFHLLEGYGSTEMAPVVSVNVPDCYGVGYKQTGHKRGTVGAPLPGIAAKVVHPESLEPLPNGKAGLLLLKGGNRMKGYYEDPALTEKAFHKEWYITGDIASLDEDGFITICDRLSRFSKIGGEMVPHLKVEEVLNDYLKRPASLVVALPDERKGEKLIALYVHESATPADLVDSLKKAGLPRLWIPRQDAFFGVEELPLLGSGKIDLQAAREIAVKLMNNISKKS